jgi:hypothetical protein
MDNMEVLLSCVKEEQHNCNNTYEDSWWMESLTDYKLKNVLLNISDDEEDFTNPLNEKSKDSSISSSEEIKSGSSSLSEDDCSQDEQEEEGEGGSPNSLSSSPEPEEEEEHQILFKDKVDKVISSFNTVPVRLRNEKAIFHEAISSLEQKDVCEFQSIAHFNDLLKYTMVQSGGTAYDLDTLGYETSKIVKEMGRRIKNRLSAKLSRKRKANERKLLICENKRLRKRVKHLEVEIDILKSIVQSKVK